MSPEDFVSHEAFLSSFCAFGAHVVFILEEFFFAFVKFLGDDYPRSRLVTAAEFLAGHVFTVVWVGVVIDGEVDPGDGFGQRCYRDRHSFGVGAEGEVDWWGLVDGRVKGEERCVKKQQAYVTSLWQRRHNTRLNGEERTRWTCHRGELERRKVRNWTVREQTSLLLAYYLLQASLYTTIHEAFL